MSQKIKVHILFDFVDCAWGGGNQFLKAVKDYLIKNDSYVDSYSEADVILINSHHNILQAIKIKFQNKGIRFVHRIDGPIYFYRDDGYYLDKLIFGVNRVLANGTIFQSNYTKNASIDRGINLENQKSLVIINAPNPLVFFRKESNFLHKKIRLIATSWSGNVKKGFDVYAWLDKNLDFNKYEMIFVGNSPIEFNNIIHKEAMNSKDLANELRESDIFIFASKVESCSNSLLEAMHSGLPVVSFNSSSNPEIVRYGGELFESAEQIPQLLEDIVANYTTYQNNINLPSINQVGKAYYEFIDDIFINAQEGNCVKKRFSWIDYLKIKKTFVWWKSKQRLIRLKEIIESK